MFGRRRRANSAADELRELLYGDVPLARLAGVEEFDAVRAALAGGDRAGARHRLRDMVTAPGGESRVCLQAWHELRALGVVPEDPTRLYGVVVDRAMGGGMETLAVYDDGTCRYLHFSGRVIVWEASDDEEIGALVGSVLAAGREIVGRIGPWEGARPPVQKGNSRVSMLCAGGLYFGEGPTRVLESDPMAAALFGNAARLLAALVGRVVDGGRAR